jgi:hypothetical protein
VLMAVTFPLWVIARELGMGTAAMLNCGVTVTVLPEMVTTEFGTRKSTSREVVVLLMVTGAET